MKVIVNPRVYAAAGIRANRYHSRRLIYQAEILRRAGHDVLIHDLDRAKQVGQDDDIRRLLGKFPGADDTSIRDLSPDDIYLCSIGYLRVHKDASMLKGKVIAWADSLSCHRGYELSRVDLFLSWICGPEEFTEQTEKAHPGINNWRFPDRQRMLSVPLIPHDLMLEQFWRDGLTDAFLDDNLEPIRKKYCREVVPGRVGFIGGGWPVRMDIIKTLGNAYIHLTHGDGRLAPLALLEKISECDAVLQLPGDTWKCARHMEAVVLGRPVVQKRGLIDVTPPLTDANTILVDQWSDMDLIRSRLVESASIVAEADKCYKEGWSLRGQILTAIRMVTE